MTALDGIYRASCCRTRRGPRRGRRDRLRGLLSFSGYTRRLGAARRRMMRRPGRKQRSPAPRPRSRPAAAARPLEATGASTAVTVDKTGAVTGASACVTGASACVTGASSGATAPVTGARDPGRGRHHRREHAGDRSKDLGRGAHYRGQCVWSLRSQHARDRSQRPGRGARPPAPRSLSPAAARQRPSDGSELALDRRGRAGAAAPLDGGAAASPAEPAGFSGRRGLIPRRHRNDLAHRPR